MMKKRSIFRMVTALLLAVCVTGLSAAASAGGFYTETAYADETDAETDAGSGTGAGTDTDTGTEGSTDTGTDTAADAGTEEETETVNLAQANTKVVLSKKEYICSGSAKKPGTTVTVRTGGSTKTLKKGRDYTVTYKNNKNVGTATVVIKGKGNYEGKVTKTFKINPRSTSIKKLTAASKAFTVTWKASAKQISGYQIQYATNASFTKGKGVYNVSKKKTKAVVNTVSANKTYYVRIRTYKKSNGSYYYSDWSSAKSVTTKTRVTAFGGDSLMTGVKVYGKSTMRMGGSIAWACYTSLNTVTFCTTTTSNGMTAYRTIVASQPYRVYIMLGMNEVCWKSIASVKADYTKLIKKIQASCPATDIVILPCSPVSSSKASGNSHWRRMDSYNAAVEEVAEKCGVTYYDFAVYFKDSSGHLASKYNGGDGIHWNYAGYKYFGKVISAYDKKRDKELAEAAKEK